MDDEVGAPFERPAQIGRGEGVVDDEGHARLVRDLGDRLEVGDDAAGIGEALDEDRLGARRERAAEILRVVGIDEAALPAEFLEAAAELGDRAAIELARGDEVDRPAP